MTISRLYIHAPAPLHYIARVREKGCRRYTVLGRFRKKERAYQKLAAAMAGGKWKRGDVLACYEWYEPSLCVEMVDR